MTAPAPETTPIYDEVVGALLCDPVKVSAEIVTGLEEYRVAIEETFPPPPPDPEPATVAMTTLPAVTS